MFKVHAYYMFSSSAKPYLKPAESTLVRHVRSRQDLEDEQTEKGNANVTLQVLI